MAKPEWGTKRICHGCGARFYDLLRDPIVCPSCGAEFDPEALLRTRRTRAVAVGRAPAPREPEVVEPEVEIVEEPVVAVEEVEEGVVADEEASDGKEVGEVAEEGSEEGKEKDSEEEEDLIEDASELGEDEDDMAEVIDQVEPEEER